MTDKPLTRERYGEAFWRKHHEAWQQSALNQREYCEAQGNPAQGFRQLAGEVQSRTAAADTETFVPTSRPKSYP